MTSILTAADEVLEKIAALDVVESAKLWTSVPGKQRIYIEMLRVDRNGRRYGGAGSQGLYIDLNAGALVRGRNGYNGGTFINSLCSSYHAGRRSLGMIEAIIAEAKEQE